MIGIKIFPNILRFIFMSIVFILLSMCTTSYALDIIFKNKTAEPLKIIWFMDSCDNVLVNAKNPIYLKPNEKTCFVYLHRVMHHYKICSIGTCQTTSIGVSLNNDLFVIEAVLKDKQVRSICKPYIWPGITSCEEIFLSNLLRYPRYLLKQNLIFKYANFF